MSEPTAETVAAEVSPPVAEPAEASAPPVAEPAGEVSPPVAVPAELTTVAAGRLSHRKVREGMVIGDKMDKTLIVAVEDRVMHPLYGKVIRRTSKLKAHDEGNQAAVGDRVLVMETRPLSASKRWRLVEIVEKAK